MFKHSRSVRTFVATHLLVSTLFVAIVYAIPCVAFAQSNADQSLAERLKAVERERDQVKERNAVLEQRLKQVQATVDKIVEEATNLSGGRSIGAARASDGPAAVPVAPYEMRSRAAFGYYSRFPPMLSPLQAPADLVQLAVAYRDALSARQAARPSSEKDRSRPSADFEAADHRVRLLRLMTKTIRQQVAGEMERISKLATVHAVPMMDVRNMETKLKILDLILAEDPDAVSMAPQPAASHTDK